ncbi:hypothetical protein V8G54_028802 [Vigna mungo]|uniref:Uncharacterized protein n=1 Tax=Vigna mungo TaxID=3915 RepID=A0AAQ3MT97_VIGMU
MQKYPSFLFGVECFSNDRVVGLSGEIPQQTSSLRLLLRLNISDNNIHNPIPNQVAKPTPLHCNALDTPTANNPHHCPNTHKDQNTNPSRKPVTNEPPTASATATASNHLRATTSRFKPTNRSEQRVRNGKAPPSNEPPSASTPPNSRRRTAASHWLTATNVETLSQ